MISKTCGYAIRGVVLLATRRQEPRKIGVQELATELNAPQPFMSKIFQDLARRQLIYSTKGPNGGFFVEESVMQLPIMAIVDAIDGQGIFKKCYLAREECSDTNPCPLHAEFASYRQGIISTFRQRTVGDLVQKVESGQTFLKVEEPAAGF